MGAASPASVGMSRSDDEGSAGTPTWVSVTSVDVVGKWLGPQTSAAEWASPGQSRVSVGLRLAVPGPIV